MSVAEDSALVAWVRAGTGLDADHVFFAQQERTSYPSGPYITLNELTRRGVGHDWVDHEENPLDLDDDVVEVVSAIADTMTLTAHGLVTGVGPVRFTTTGTLPAPLEGETDCWVIRVDANTIKVAERFLDAMNATPVAIDLTDAGTGTHTLVGTEDTVLPGAEIEYVVRGTREIVVSVQCFAGVTSGDVASPVGASSPRAMLETLRAKSLLPSVRSGLLAAGLGLAEFGPVQDIGRGMDATIFEPRAVASVRFIAMTEVRETGTVIETVELDNEITSTSSWVPEAP